MRIALPFLLLTNALAAQVTWQQLAPPTTPSPRAWHGMVFDATGTAILFGGFGDVGGFSTWHDDTWLFDGGIWTLAQPATRPRPRSGHALCYDTARGRTVLFGGNTGGTSHSDTWEWDGTNWLNRTPATSPSRRTHASMTYDQLRDRYVLFGGRDSSFNALNDTWEWDGGTWTRIFPATRPGARFVANMAFDSARGRVVLFGGRFGFSSLDDTWEYDGVNWYSTSPAVKPLARASAAMTFDALRARTVLVGGAATDTISLDDVWEWDGTDWVQRQPSGATIATSCGRSLAFSPAHGRSFLFGGAPDFLSGGMSTDTLAYGAAVLPAATAYGQGCAGTAGTPALTADAPPWVGHPLPLSLSSLPTSAPALLVAGWSDSAWAGMSLPLALASYGAPGCSLLARPDATWFATAAGSVASWTIPVTTAPALLGMTLFFQGTALDPSANPGGFVVSDALAVTFGGR